MQDVTHILNAASKGDKQAAEELLPLVYNELRRLAAGKMSAEQAGHTLQATALVHEAWMRLSGGEQRNWENRAHFFGAAAEAMRRILVEHARRRNAIKRGSGVEHLELEESSIVLAAPADELLAINEALDKFAQAEPEAAELVKLRYFVGMTMQESADALNLPLRSAERLWTYARAWLKREIRNT